MTMTTRANRISRNIVISPLFSREIIKETIGSEKNREIQIQNASFLLVVHFPAKLSRSRIASPTISLNIRRSMSSTTSDISTDRSPHPSQPAISLATNPQMTSSEMSPAGGLSLIFTNSNHTWWAKAWSSTAMMAAGEFDLSKAFHGDTCCFLRRISVTVSKTSRRWSLEALVEEEEE